MGKINQKRITKKPTKNVAQIEVDLKPKKLVNATLFKAKQIVEKKVQQIIAPAATKQILKQESKPEKLKNNPLFKAKQTIEKKTQLITPPATNKHTTKKEKREEKHKNLLKKFQDQKKKDKEERMKKIREKTAVVGDMKPMKDSLPSLDELLSLDRNHMKTGIKEVDLMSAKKLSKVEKSKKKKNEMIGRLNCFQSWLQDSEYKKNPREAIAAHIKFMKKYED